MSDYDAGYDRGYGRGYDDGYDVGYDDGFFEENNPGDYVEDTIGLRKIFRVIGEVTYVCYIPGVDDDIKEFRSDYEKMLKKCLF